MKSFTHTFKQHQVNNPKAINEPDMLTPLLMNKI